jgi:hypothetical protein
MKLLIHRIYGLTFVALAALAFGCARGPEPPVPAPELEPATPERHVALDGQPNFRDLGGYETTDGRTVKWGEVYRSGELPRLSDKDVAKLEELEIHSVVSFLTEKEIEARGPDRLPDGTLEVALPMEAGNLGDLLAVVVEARNTGDFSEVPARLLRDIAAGDRGSHQPAARLSLFAWDPPHRHCGRHPALRPRCAVGDRARGLSAVQYVPG